MSLADSLAEVMSECGSDAIQLTTQMADDHMHPIEARRIWNNWKEKELVGTGKTMVSWEIDGQWMSLETVRCHNKITIWARSCVPALRAEQDGEEVVSNQHFYVPKFLGTVTTPEQTVRDMLDYRHAPKCAGKRRCCEIDQRPTLWNSVTGDETTDYDDFENVEEVEEMRCINVVHKEGELCGECLAATFFETDENYKYKITYQPRHNS